MKLIFISLFFLSPFANALNCQASYKYLQKLTVRYELNTVHALCDFLDEIGMESEEVKGVYACRNIISGRCPTPVDYDKKIVL